MSGAPTPAWAIPPGSTRADLTFLRHRARPRPVPVEPVALPEPAAPAEPLVLAAPGAPAAPLVLAAPAEPLTLAAPTEPLTLAEPPAPVVPVVSVAPAATPLVPPVPAARPAPAPTAPAPAAVSRFPALPPLVRGIPRVVPGERRVLTPDAPVVMLNRVQSGVGALKVSFETSVPAGLAVGFELDGRERVLRGPGPAHGPDHRRPAVSVTGSTASFDLGQVRSLDRALVTVRAARYDGVVVVTTLGGSRLEVPIVHEGTGGDLVALSIYRVRGALVVRAEVDHVEGGLREAMSAYGYGELTWRDKDTPLAD